MSALPPLNRGTEAYRSRVEIWSTQIDSTPPLGKRSQQRSLGNRRREAPEVLAEAGPTPQPRRAVALESSGQADPVRAVSVAAVRSVVPTTAVELRVAYGLSSVPVALELVPAQETTAAVAVDGDTVLATGRVHRFAADFYARAASVGYSGRRSVVGASLDVRA